jgi:hypothetical protein
MKMRKKMISAYLIYGVRLYEMFALISALFFLLDVEYERLNIIGQSYDCQVARNVIQRNLNTLQHGVS